MGSFLLIAGLIALFAALAARSASRRRRTLVDRITQAVQADASEFNGNPGGLGQAVARAVEEALAHQGLAPESVSVTTSVSMGASVARTAAADDGTSLDGLAIGDVTAISSITGARVATVALDAIGAPRRRVTVDLPEGLEVASGDRRYVRVDPDRPDRAFLLPNIAPPPTRNRLDPLVLQPMLLARGERGQAVVRAAEPADLGRGLPAGASGWRLDLEVTPRGGFPCRAEVAVVVSTPEKVARICHAGAQVAVRYDPIDPKTVLIDTAAMGFASEQPRWSGADADPAAAIDWNSLAAADALGKFKAVRQRTALDPAQAKGLVDAVDGDATSQMVAMLSGRRTT